MPDRERLHQEAFQATQYATFEGDRLAPLFAFAVIATDDLITTFALTGLQLHGSAATGILKAVAGSEDGPCFRRLGNLFRTLENSGTGYSLASNSDSHPRLEIPSVSATVPIEIWYSQNLACESFSRTVHQIALSYISNASRNGSSVEPVSTEFHIHCGDLA